MAKAKRWVRLKTLLTGDRKGLRKRTQQEVAAVFGKSQTWVSLVLKNHPEATVTLKDHEPVAIQFQVTKTHDAVNVCNQEG